MNKSNTIACVGEAMVELSLDANDESVARIGFAGDTLNTAIYLKRCLATATVAYVTRLGTDKFSDDMVRFMESEDLSTTLIDRDPNRTPGLYAISTDPSGERSFSYWRSASAARELFTAPQPDISVLAAHGLVYFSAITLAILRDDARDKLLQWLPDYRASGGQLAFDSNYRPALWQDRATAQRTVSAFWKETDIALPSIDDEIALFGDSDESGVLSRLKSWGATSGALKRGPLGPVALDGTSSPAFAPAERVVDSTAAGDSFNAGYLAGRLSGRTEADCLREGHDLARRVVGTRGAILPREEQRNSI